MDEPLGQVISKVALKNLFFLIHQGIDRTKWGALPLFQLNFDIMGPMGWQLSGLLVDKDI